MDMGNLVIPIMTRVIEARNIGCYYLQKPFRLIVAGGSGSGKTRFVQKLINSEHFSSPFGSVTYYLPSYVCDNDDTIEFDRPVQFKTGIPSTADLSQVQPNSLLIFDDMMHECSKSDKMERLFSVIARKRNISIILTVQNIYHPGLRHIRINSTGLVLFKFFAAMDVNKRIIKSFGLKNLITTEQLDTVYEERYGYIYVNIHPDRHYDFGTLRANIFDYSISVYYQMEYIAIPKADFIKYFKIIESKNGKIKAVKNAIEVKPKRRRATPAPKRAKTSNTIEESATDSTSEESEG